jgi:hypothetical protein
MRLQTVNHTTCNPASSLSQEDVETLVPHRA